MAAVTIDIDKLSAGPNLRAEANALRNHGTPGGYAASGLDKAQSQLDSHVALMKQLNTSLVGAQAAIAALPDNLLLEATVVHAGTTTINSPAAPSANDRLTVVLTNDATGGGLIAWGAGFKGVGADKIDNRATLLNVYNFIGRADGNWWLAGEPALGLNP